MKTVKPRPLHVADPIPVFWNIGEEDGNDSEFLGALLDVEPEDAAAVLEGPVTLIDHDGNPIPRYGTGKNDHPSSSVQMGTRISVPTIRATADYQQTNVAAMSQSAAVLKSQPDKRSYIRHMLSTSRADEQQPEYCMDDEDEAWLKKFNDKAARSTSKQQGEQPSLTAEQLERLVDKLEQLHFDRLVEWYEDEDGPSTSCAIPKIPPLQNILSRRDASSIITCEDRRTVEAAYEHWKQRRRQHGGPLLQRLWFEQPWCLVCYGPSVDLDEDKQNDRDAILDELPFSRRDKSVRSGARRRRLNAEAARELLVEVRGELERLRTLADRVRRREKLKKQVLQLWQQEGLLRVEELQAASQQGPEALAAKRQQHWDLEEHSRQRAAELAKAAAPQLPSKKRRGRPPKPRPPPPAPLPQDPLQQLLAQAHATVLASSKRPLELSRKGPGRPSKLAKLQECVPSSPRTSALAKRLLSNNKYNKTRAQKAAAEVVMTHSGSLLLAQAQAAQTMQPAAVASAASAPQQQPAQQSALAAAAQAGPPARAGQAQKQPSSPGRSARPGGSKAAATQQKQKQKQKPSQPQQPQQPQQQARQPVALSSAQQAQQQPCSPARQALRQASTKAAAAAQGSKQAAAQRRFAPQQQQQQAAWAASGKRKAGQPSTPGGSKRSSAVQSAAARLVHQAKATVRSPRLLRETDIVNVLPQLDGSRLTRAVARQPASPKGASRLASSCTPSSSGGGKGGKGSSSAGTKGISKHKKRRPSVLAAAVAAEAAAAAAAAAVAPKARSAGSRK